jgi:hypothetical protein
MNDLFYWGAVIWLSGCIGGITLSALLAMVSIKLGWIRIIEIAAPLSQGVCSNEGLRGGSSGPRASGSTLTGASRTSASRAGLYFFQKGDK